MQFLTTIVQLPLVRQVAGVNVKTSEDVFRVCRDIANLAQESFHVLSINVKNKLIGRSMASLGTVDSCTVHPREVFRSAVMNNASAIVLVHNHPSGDPTPSAGDLRITNQLIEAGKIVDIRVLDHVIIGAEMETGTNRRYISLREEGLCKF